MPIQIGKPTTPLPLDLIGDCHRRVERFLWALEHVAHRAPAPLDAAERTALAAALRYFSEAAPLHTADEERSLLPRVRATGLPEVTELEPRLQDLEADHRRADALHATTERIGRRWLGGERVEVADFVAAVGALAALYPPHIRFEDEVLVPLARRVLSTDQQQAIEREMTERRRPSAQ